jgi:hypothetical protein
MTILWGTLHTLIYHPVKLWRMKIIFLQGKFQSLKWPLLCIKYLEPFEKCPKISFRLPVMHFYCQNCISS